MIYSNLENVGTNYGMFVQEAELSELLNHN